MNFIQVVTKKPAKVIVGQRFPVKFPGAVPGSSYTFVTIPALTGPPLPATGPKKVSIHPARTKKEPVKYSVVARHAGQVQTAISLPANVATQSPNVAVSVPPKTVTLKSSNILKPVTVVSTPAATASHSAPVTRAPTITSSVILHKLWNEAVAAVGDGNTSNASKDNKEDSSS